MAQLGPLLVFSGNLEVVKLLFIKFVIGWAMVGLASFGDTPSMCVAFLTLALSVCFSTKLNSISLNKI